MKRPIKGVAVEEDQYDKIRFPTCGFPKIDGFRCVLGQYPMTSRLSRFPNHAFHRSLKGLLPADSLLDSEVVVGRKRGSRVLRRTSSGLTSQDGNPDYNLWVFDHFDRRAEFLERYDVAARLVKELGHPNVRLLKYRWLENREDLEAYLEDMLDREYEGVILRRPDGIYKEGKSTLREQHMLKLKPFDTAEGRIKGWFEEERNDNEAKREKTGKLKRSSAKAGKVGKGSLGGFILEDVKTKVEVRVGGGFTKRQREGLWRLIQEDPRALLDELVTYKKQRMGEGDKPRHPGFVDFVAIRPAWDFTED